MVSVADIGTSAGLPAVNVGGGIVEVRGPVRPAEVVREACSVGNGSGRRAGACHGRRWCSQSQLPPSLSTPSGGSFRPRAAVIWNSGSSSTSAQAVRAARAKARARSLGFWLRITSGLNSRSQRRMK